MMPSSLFCIYAHIVPNVGCYCVNKARMSASFVLINERSIAFVCVYTCLIHLFTLVGPLKEDKTLRFYLWDTVIFAVSTQF